MHAYQTQVSQASHENLNPPEVAGQVEVLSGVNGQVAPPPLSEAQLAVFWAGIVANLDAAERMAAGIVRSQSQSAEDIVHTAALLLLENAQRSNAAEPFPVSPDQFRSKFLTTVRNHALKCIRDSKRPACPVHSHWGIDPEPELRGHKLADRELDTLFARNDRGTYDAPAPTVRRAKNDLDGLHYILHNHMEDLSQTQREIIIETYFEQQPRDKIAARRGISLNTYDNHRKAACRKLRESLMAVVDFCTDIDLPDWYDRVEEMNTRHAAGQRRRAARKKENRQNSEGDRSNFECAASNSRRDA